MLCMLVTTHGDCDGCNDELMHVAEGGAARGGCGGGGGPFPSQGRGLGPDVTPAKVGWRTAGGGGVSEGDSQASALAIGHWATRVGVPINGQFPL